MLAAVPQVAFKYDVQLSVAPPGEPAHVQFQVRADESYDGVAGEAVPYVQRLSFEGTEVIVALFAELHNPLAGA